MELNELLNRDIVCSCGRVHRCDIPRLEISEGALERLPALTEGYGRILLAADENTWTVCGERVLKLLEKQTETVYVFPGKDLLVPDESAIKQLEDKITEQTDLVLGIGSGVINDLCKYTAFRRGIVSGIIATAPSMDGFASSGAAMIIDGMKVTYTVNAPVIIVGDIDVLKNAPMDMIRSGYADIIGKYSALCDWKLSELINGEYLCPFVYDLVLERTNALRAAAKALTKRDAAAVKMLTETLVLIGACLTLLSTTRPGSGSEHHLSHYFEITGLIDGTPYFLHGTDVGYATVVTAGLREEITKIATPEFSHISKGLREGCYRKIYQSYWSEVKALQDGAKRYDTPKDAVYREKWNEVLSILKQCPTADEIRQMLLDVGFDLSAFEANYGKEKIRNGVWFGKDLKDRYSVLWLYADLFLTEEEALRIKMKDGTLDFMQESIRREEEALRALGKAMDRTAFARALQYLLDSDLVVISACGSSGFTGKKFAHSLCCVEKPAKFVPPSEAVHGGMGVLKAGNALVLISKGGKSDELTPLVAIARAKKAKIITVTAKPESPLGQASDVVLQLPDVPESDRYGVMSTASFVATIGIFDALMMGIMEETGYSDRDFAVIHPGGAVGKQLNS